MDKLVGREQEIKLLKIKYSETDFRLDIEEAKKLQNRMVAFRDETKTKKALWLTLLTTYGLNEGRYSSTFVSVLTMDDLFL